MTPSEPGFWIVAVLVVATAATRLLSKKGRGGRGSGGTGRTGSGTARGAGGVARLKSRPAQGVLEADLSPGRAGSGATRDLSRQEIASIRPEYSPRIDGDPDPGEVVWTWVPYVENDGRGKDRPVLIIANLGLGAFAGCYLSTKQHRGFVSIGTGDWDSQHRESFLSPERVLMISTRGMRREGTAVSKAQFDRAVSAVSAVHGLGR